MKQKILEALKAKFPGVNANVLNRIAVNLATKILQATATAVRQKPNRQPYKPMKPNTV